MEQKKLQEIERIRSTLCERLDADEKWVTIKGTHVLIDKEGNLQGEVGKKISSSSKKSGNKTAGSASKKSGNNTAGSASKKVKLLADKLDHARDVEALNDYISAVIEQDDPDAEYPEDPTDYHNQKTVTCKTPEDKKKLIGGWLDKAIKKNGKELLALSAEAEDTDEFDWEIKWRKECDAYYKGLKKQLGDESSGTSKKKAAETKPKRMTAAQKKGSGKGGRKSSLGPLSWQNSNEESGHLVPKNQVSRNRYLTGGRKSSLEENIYNHAQRIK